jgi:hypothetical protein
MSSLNNLARALERGDPDAALRTNNQTPPLSANLCEALLEMTPEGEESVLDISLRWDHNHPPGDGLPQIVRLRRDLFGRIEALAARLLPTPSPHRQTFVGRVETLEGRPNPDGQREGAVTLQILLPEGETSLARAELNAADHHTAWLAYERNQLVMFQGVLRGAIRAARIEDVGEFRLVEDRVPA